MLSTMGAEQIYELCVHETVRFVHDVHFEDVIIGLSGGIDSSLVATMAVDGLGASHVHGILLPGPFSSDHSITDAEQLAANLGIDRCIISINEAYEAFARSFALASGTALSGLAAENTQARCRMVYLMAFSNAEGWMMLNTGNRSEAAMGYSTLYGDTAGAFAPLGGLYKSDVFALARWRNGHLRDLEDVPPIPPHVIEKPPSAELSADQRDEASLGIDYAALDRLLLRAIDEGATEEELRGEGFASEQIAMVLRRFEASGFKRALEPPFPETPFYG